MQIRINSTKMIRITQVENEEKLKELEEFNMWNYIGSFFKEKLNDTYISIGLYSNKTCLKVELVEPDTNYSIVIARSMSCSTLGCWLAGEVVLNVHLLPVAIVGFKPMASRLWDLQLSGILVGLKSSISRNISKMTYSPEPKWLLVSSTNFSCL